MKYDFSGYATKNDLKCSDGRIIRRDAFAHNDGIKVPLVWQHAYDNPGNILGHAYLENREDGVYAYGKFNETKAGENAKQLVKHGDISAMSIFANKLKQNGPNVIHGNIREVSLVMSGANPGAMIDNINMAHSDGTLYDIDTEEAIIYTGEELKHSDDGKGEDMSDQEKTVQEVFDTLSDEQKNVVYALIGQAIEENEVQHSDDEYEGDDFMKHNIFEQDEYTEDTHYLTHDEMQEVLNTAFQTKGSVRDAMLAHAVQEYGIENIDYLFPEARTIDKTPDFIQREMAWVGKVMGSVYKSPFSRIKSIHADITADEARAKGYVTGNLKKEEVFKLLKRATTPTTIYKKQKLDRDDVIDITDFDVVAWMKGEMRLMLNEEIARAILIGDGRAFDDEDKINEEHIRPIWKENELYAHRVEIAADRKPADMIEDIVRSHKHYKGKGSPTMYTTTDTLLDMLLVKDQMGRRIYNSQAELEKALRVKEIVEVEVMENLTRTDESENTFKGLAIIVNLSDYVVGADKGGQVSLFDDFDIDYNQMKYLMETRMSGALRYPKSALVIEQPAEAGVAEPGAEG